MLVRLLVLALESVIAVGVHQTYWSIVSGSVSSPRNVIHGYQTCFDVQFKHGEWRQLEDSLTVGLNDLRTSMIFSNLSNSTVL